MNAKNISDSEFAILDSIRRYLLDDDEFDDIPILLPSETSSSNNNNVTASSDVACFNMQLRRPQKSFRGVRKRPWGKFAAEIRDGKKKTGQEFGWGLMIHLRMLHWLTIVQLSTFTAKKLSLIFLISLALNLVVLMLLELRINKAAPPEPSSSSCPSSSSSFYSSSLSCMQCWLTESPNAD